MTNILNLPWILNYILYINTLILALTIILCIAVLTLAERKILGSFQRRLGPNRVGPLGLLQPIADGLKLFLKETITTATSNSLMMTISPLILFIFSLLLWAIIPFQLNVMYSDQPLGILYILAISSLGIYAVLFAGWSPNSKYAFLGAMRSAAQMVAYEIVISLIVFIIMLFTIESHNLFNFPLNLSKIMLSQFTVWNILPLLPLFIIFLIAILAETNRAPFDLIEAESELVAGFFTEHSSFSFALFFLAEYLNMIFMSYFTNILFLAGGLFSGFKTIIILYFYIWVRASFPRLRYDQLIEFCWIFIIPIMLSLFLFYSTYDTIN